MQRYVLRADDGPSHDDRGARAAGAETAGGVTLVHPETPNEYERALAEVWGTGRSSAGDEPSRPGEDGPQGLAAAAGAYVVTSSEQRRAWGLPVLVDVDAATVRTCDELRRAWSRDAVPLADARDAVSLLVGVAAGRRASSNDRVSGDGTRECGPPAPASSSAEVVNLRNDRGPIPDEVREAFRELCRQPRVDSVLVLIDAVVQPLEDALPELAASRQREVAPAIRRIRGVVDARREVGVGEWDDAAVGRIRRLVRRLEDAREVLDEDCLPNDKVEAVREGLKALDVERQSGDPLAATAREVLGLLESADLPLPVLARALDEVRLAQAQGWEAAAVLLERLRVVAELPWRARASERVDIEAAMAELEGAHAGRCGGQGADPPVPGHAPADVDDVDRGGAQPR